MAQNAGETPIEFLKAAEEKWQRTWDDAGVFNAEPLPGTPKFFGNFPYSYMNGRPHVGHAFTLMRVEFMCRYKRMTGHNVLFPLAFHCTGTPIVAAAQRIAKGDQKQMAMMREQGVSDADIPSFSDPEKWARHFPAVWERDIRRMGASIDWRRKFITTSLNPHYDRFVAWQFRKLKEKGYVALGSHPVIWCPSCNAPVGDHDRVSGEDERVTPVEYALLKFSCGGLKIIAATLRPETVYGQTNIWVDPGAQYAKVEVGGPGAKETWVVSPLALAKLVAQAHPEAKDAGRIPGSELVGMKCLAPGINREIPVLPSKFCDLNMGSGIVTSVPSDAPDDWIALKDLQESPDECAKYGLNPAEVKKIQPIPIIRSRGFGDFPAAEVCKQLGVKNQTERDKLEKAKEIVYKSGFYTGVMTDLCGEYAGMPVAEAKEIIKRKLTESGDADRIWEPSGESTCRCLTKAMVRLVANQWFIKYGDPEWKKLVKAAFDGGETPAGTAQPIRLYPELARRQFHHVIDWLADWACTREYGLGSHLPWDPKWVIESLSDSTIYMAYYTISGHFAGEGAIPAESLSDDFFDFVFLGKGSLEDVAGKSNIDAQTLRKMRAEFDYWYPFDLRNSGKELVQNHLTFCVFNHTAIFSPAKWPRGIGINGWLLVDRQKMSKSLGNSINLDDAVERFGADCTRFALASAGEGMDDPSFELETAQSAAGRLYSWHRFATENYGKGRAEAHPADKWFASRMNEIAGETAAAMEETRFRSAIKSGYFDLQSAFRWYLERCGAVGPSRELQDAFIETQTLVLAPFVPHLCETVWAGIGKTGYISLAQYPEHDAAATDSAAMAAEDLIRSVLSDAQEILKIYKGTPSKITLYTSPAWKVHAMGQALSMCDAGKADAGALIKALMADPANRPFAKEIPKFAQKCLEDCRRLSGADKKARRAGVNEAQVLESAKEFLSNRLGAAVSVLPADGEGLHDPAKKAKFASPWRPGIYVE